MTKEEIKEAAKKVARNTYYTYISEYGEKIFIKGVEFANKHWQEKTRWINPREQRPEIKKTPYHVLYKRYDGMIGVHRIMVDYDIAFLLINCVGWKEIEL